ncbi:MAG: NADH-quinone oxidoreductase subunit M [Azonexus sp.]|nr:NADH-quinone oxidoreductase subunit M [Azonexus sp.]MCK6413256.1 NADH-quinone oxidoreductase subunit M [Azonexus sp.]
MSFPLLSCLIALPLAGALLLWLLPERLARAGAAFFLSASFLLACIVLVVYEPQGERFQLIERARWLPGVNAHYLLAVDGLSILFLPATALLFLGGLVVDWNALRTARRLYYSLQLALLAATLGIFSAVDTLLFFLFWELALIPLYFLLARFGVTEGAPRVAARYALLMLSGGAALLLAFALLAAERPGAGFDLLAWLAEPAGMNTQWAVFLLCLFGFGIKAPLVPLHTWLPQFALAAPGSLLAPLLGLKLGVYGLIRFALPLAPDVVAQLHWLLAGLGTLALLYGAVSMLAQSNLRQLLACASISHVGLALLGLAQPSAESVQGAVALLLGFVLSSGGACLLLECLRQRIGSTDLQALGGAGQRLPLLATGFLACGLAGAGLPGSSGFPGEFLLLLAVLPSHTGAGMAALFALSIAIAAFLRAYRQAFWGAIRRAEVERSEDLRPRERRLLLLLLCLLLAGGLYPAPWLDVIRPAAEAWATGMLRPS